MHVKCWLGPVTDLLNPIDLPSRESGHLDRKLGLSDQELIHLNRDLGHPDPDSGHLDPNSGRLDLDSGVVVQFDVRQALACLF